MAEIIPVVDRIRARRRQHQEACAQRCIEIIELNLRVALDGFDSAPPEERPHYARRVRILGELLEYSVRAL